MKQAALHQEKIEGYEDDMLKAAYVQGMDDAALMAAADETKPAEITTISSLAARRAPRPSTKPSRWGVRRCPKRRSSPCSRR